MAVEPRPPQANGGLGHIRSAFDLSVSLRPIVVTEHNTWPRGHVVYEQAPARFIIYTDAQLLAAPRLASIRAAFALSHDWTVTRTTRTTAKSPPLQMAKYDQSPSGRARTPGDAAVTPSNYPTTAEALAWLTRQRIPHRQVSPHRIAVGQKINWYLVKGTIVLDAVQRRHHATGFPALEQLLALRQNPA